MFVIFVILTPIAVWLILYLLSRSEKDEATDESEGPIEVCALCQIEFPMNRLLEKEIGGYGRIYCFCGQCIENLYYEYRNAADTEESTPPMGGVPKTSVTNTKIQLKPK